LIPARGGGGNKEREKKKNKEGRRGGAGGVLAARKENSLLPFFFWASRLQQRMMKECWMVQELEKQLVGLAAVVQQESPQLVIPVLASVLSVPFLGQLGDRS
jgi:hypothetical protein